MGGVLENSYQKFAKDIIIIGITQPLVAVSGLVLLPLLTKTLGAHDYGIWTQASVTIELVIGLVGLGLPFAMIRFLAAESERKEIQEGFYSVFCLVFFTSLIISSVMIASPGFIANSLFEGATNIVRIVGFIILVWNLDCVFLNLFRTFREMGRYSIFMLARAYGELGLIAYLVSSDHGIFSVVSSLLAIRAALFLILLLSVRSRIGIRIPNFSRIREYLSFGLPTVPGNISAWVVASSDRYVIASFLGVTSVGFYSSGYVLGNIPFMIAGVLSFVFIPALSKLHDEGRINEVKTHLSYSLKYFLALAIPFVFGAAALSEPVLRIFSTPEIASEGRSIVPLVALSTLFFGVYVVVVQILILVKKTKTIGVAWLLAASVNLLLNILIVPHVGIIGAAITTLIAYSLALGIVTYYSFKQFKFNIEWSFITKSLVASAIMSLAVWLADPCGTLAVILTVVIGVIIYGVILLLLKGFKKEEIRFFRGLFQRGS